MVGSYAVLPDGSDRTEYPSRPGLISVSLSVGVYELSLSIAPVRCAQQYSGFQPGLDAAGGPNCSHVLTMALMIASRCEPMFLVAHDGMTSMLLNQPVTVA